MKTTSNTEEVVIRSGIPIPPLPPRKHRAGPITTAMRKMAVGDCIDLTTSIVNINQRARTAGMKYITRLVTDEKGKLVRRVWKTGDLKYVKKYKRKK